MSHMDELIEKVASDSPTPGGGSVSALASSLGCALNEMVSRLSLKKESDQGVTGKLRTVLDKRLEWWRHLGAQWLGDYADEFHL